MTTFTNISDEVLEPGKPIRSVDVLALRDNTNYNHENTVLEILREDIFTTSGTWTKASGFDHDDTVMLFVIGGGASGGAFRRSTENAVATGGSHASITILVANYGSVNSSYHCVVGAGGAPTTATSVNPTRTGINGNNTVLYQGTSSSGLLIAVGAGGYRGNTGIGTRAAESSGDNFIICKNLTLNSRVERNGGGEQDFQIFTSSGTAGATAYSDENSLRQVNFLGAGGVGAFNTTFFNPPIPGIIKSLGGAGNSNGNGVAGSAPGGGGGGGVRTNADVTSGAGGGGGLIVRYYRGRVSPFQVIFTGG